MQRALVPFMTAVVAAAVAVACIPAPPGVGGGSGRAMRHVSKEAPSPAHEVGALLGGKVELVGYDMEPAEPEPGKTVRVTWYWRCIEPLGGDYRIFTHLVDAETGRMAAGGNFDTSTIDDLRSVYPPGQWKAGEYISDTQRLSLPEKLPFAEAELRIGIYTGSTRLQIEKGPRDRTRRVRGPRFETGFEVPAVPEIVVPLITDEITVDGRLDEVAWAGAARTGLYVNATDGRPGRPRTKAKMLYDAEHLYLGFECEDDNIHSEFTKRDDHLWQQDAVEVFIDAPAKGRDYYELQVSPAGKLFDTLVHRHPRRDDSWDARARAAARTDGTLNDDSDVDRSWTAELAVPLSSLAKGGASAGDRWRLNLFRLDDRLGDRRAFLAWSTPLSNTTHVPERFGIVVFGGASPAGAETAEAGAPATDGGAPAREASAASTEGGRP